MKGFVVAMLISAVSAPAMAQAVTEPETCLTARGIAVDHAGKRYTVRDESCRQMFLSDPERYAQLFDALSELEAAGKPVAVARPSLVPS